ncbi:hypothetical protein AMECASPLE_001567, partial [Ameca splendens]
EQICQEKHQTEMERRKCKQDTVKQQSPQLSKAEKFISACPFALLFTQLAPSAWDTLTCRGPLAGMVDLIDAKSMSRPCSPLSVFPSPCIIRPAASGQEVK